MSGVPFQQDDGGRATSRRPRQKNDCVVRACAITTGLPYDQVYNEFAALGRRCGRGTDRKAMVVWLKYRATYHAFQAMAGQPRVHLDVFSQTIGTSGRWIVRVAGHATAVIDGAIHDTSRPRQDACVYCAWRINE
ncbi:MAG: hypothetical protein WC326_01895 [Candidatus Delongbacteria bacterium]